MAKRPCARVGCPRLVRRGYCEEHTQRRAAVPGRVSAARRGYDYSWQRYTTQRLREHPLCVDPFGLHAGRHVLARATDHIIAAHGQEDPLFWDESNHQSLCWRCHSYKTACKDGGFGHSPQPKG